MSQTYNYTKQVNIIDIQEAIETSSITIALDSIEATTTAVDVIFKAALSASEETILNDIITNHVYNAPEVDNELKFDTNGKLLMHQSLRPEGFTTYFTGAGDDLTDITNYGDGPCLNISHKIGDPLSGQVELGFNSIENETWIYEGYMNWQGADCDCISLMVKAPAPAGIAFTGTGDFDIHESGLIIPAAPGSGLVDIPSGYTALAEPYGGLIEMPKNVDGNRSPGLWSADWNVDTKKFENITFKPDGSGLYNIFPQDTILDRFVNQYTINGMGTQELDSEDSKQLGHGMRIILQYMMDGPLFNGEADHDWNCAVNFTMHRQKTI